MAHRAAPKALAVAALACLAAGCALFPRRVKLSYAASRNVERRERQTRLQFMPFVDRRKDRSNMGKASVALELGSVPIKPAGDPLAWINQAVVTELAAAGYQAGLEVPTRVGGSLRELSCGSGKRTICAIKLEVWVVQESGWQILKQEYSGEGIRPPLFAGEDPYQLSLQEALREALAQFRRDVERLIP